MCHLAGNWSLSLPVHCGVLQVELMQAQEFGMLRFWSRRSAQKSCLINEAATTLLGDRLDFGQSAWPLLQQISPVKNDMLSQAS